MVPPLKHTDLWSVGVPNSLVSSLGLILDIFTLQVFWSRLPFTFLQFRPTIFKNFRSKICTINFDSANITRYVVVGGKRMDRREANFFADSKSPQEFSRLVCPWL